MKTLDNTNVAEVRQKVPDVVAAGNGDTFRLLCKASSKAENWMKSCKAMEIPGVGVVVQVTTQQGDHVAEALCFVPGVRIISDVAENLWMTEKRRIPKTNQSEQNHHINGPGP